MSATPDENIPGFHQYLARSLTKHWKRYSRKLRPVQKSFTENAVHDSRVEARRLLSFVELLCAFGETARIKKARRALKRHLDAFDGLRDVQVQLLHLAGLTRRFAAARAFQAHLLKREKRLAAEARKEIKRLKTARLARWVDRLIRETRRRHHAPGAARDFGRVLRSVDRAFARVQALKARVRPANTQTIHRTRVAFKRFRYMVEALADLLPGVSPSQINAMHAYQTLMGEIQDVEVLKTAFEHFTNKASLSKASVARLRDEFERRHQKAVQAYLDGAEQLREFWPLLPVRDAAAP